MLPSARARTYVLLRILPASNIDLQGAFASLANENGLVLCIDLQRAFEGMHLGFAPRDIANIVALADPQGTGLV